jgi:hypothetical protein
MNKNITLREVKRGSNSKWRDWLLAKASSLWSTASVESVLGQQTHAFAGETGIEHSSIPQLSRLSASKIKDRITNNPTELSRA